MALLFNALLIACFLGFVVYDIRRQKKRRTRLEAAYLEKDRILDDQILTADRLIKTLSTEKEEAQRQCRMVKDLVDHLKPFVDQLTRTY